MKKNMEINQANRRRRLLVNLLVLIMILGLGKTVDAGSICTYEEGSSAEIEYVRTWGCYHNPNCFSCDSILNPLIGDCKNEILINVKVKNTGTKKCWYKAEVYTTKGSHIYFIADGEIEPGNARTLSRDTANDGSISTEQFSDRYVARIFVCTESGWLGLGCDKWMPLPPTTAKEVCCGACSCDEDGQHGVDCFGGCEASCECDGEYPGGSVCGSNCYPVGETPPTPIEPCSQGVCESANTFPPACKCGDPGGEETEDGKRFCCASLGKVFTDKDSCDASCIPCPYGACEEKNTEPFPCTCGGLDGEDTYEGSLFCCASQGKVFADKASCDASCTPTPPPEIPEEEIEYTDEYRGCGDITYEEDCDCGGCCCDCEGAEGCEMHCKWRSRIEQKTDLIDIPRTVVQHITIPKVSHENILDNTKISVTEVIDQYVDEWGGRRIYGILNVTLEPDILSEFLYVVNDSAILYSPMFYPVKHYLYRKNLGPGPATRQYNYSDNYGLESVEEYEFPQECKRTCPPSISSLCQCTEGDRTDVICTDISTGEEYYPNKD
ncbi:MAG: hypothetical protein U9Q22_03900, partial [Candidatus Altiarchaeota archaeon]|nr:hypothetical protein [Candidatus Altiarchaeota archaeon]